MIGQTGGNTVTNGQKLAVFVLLYSPCVFTCYLELESSNLYGTMPSSTAFTWQTYRMGTVPVLVYPMLMLTWLPAKAQTT